jgi:hypothetical protein
MESQTSKYNRFEMVRTSIFISNFNANDDVIEISSQKLSTLLFDRHNASHNKNVNLSDRNLIQIR